MENNHIGRIIGGSSIIILLFCFVCMWIYNMNKNKNSTYTLFYNNTVKKEIWQHYVIIKGNYEDQNVYFQMVDLNTPDSIICKHLQEANDAVNRAKYIQEEFKCF